MRGICNKEGHDEAEQEYRMTFAPSVIPGRASWREPGMTGEVQDGQVRLQTHLVPDKAQKRDAKKKGPPRHRGRPHLTSI
jgi:hypothetical protein